MSNFDNITSITSFDDLKQNKINENKDYIILFFYSKKCGACHMAVPIVCDVYNNNLTKQNNCKIVKVHINDIKDNELRNLYKGGVPAFRVLKKNNNLYDIYNVQNDNNYNYLIDGFAGDNYSDKNNKYLSTKNTLIDWIDILSKTPLPIKENYNKLNNIVYRLKSPQLDKMKNKRYFEKNQDDGSGYSIMQLCDPYVKELNKSFNKIINDNIKMLNKKN